jgi:hypothetical protein
LYSYKESLEFLNLGKIIELLRIKIQKNLFHKDQT